jgi:predicted Zn finger-like uncharacterized protein
MIIVCPSCQSRYRFDEAKLGDRPSVKTRCAKCKGTIEIQNPISSATMPPDIPAPAPEPPAAPAPPAAPEPPLAPAPPPAPEPPQAPAPPPTPVPAAQRTQETAVQHEFTPSTSSRTAGAVTVAGGDAHQMGLLQLPTDRRFSLAIIQGPATGQIFQITKTRTVIGRSGTDINLDDPEASRQHAALEIVGDIAVLRDLGSTNGTWIELERIEQHQLSNQQEFRIGSHVVMFIVTEVE